MAASPNTFTYHILWHSILMGSRLRIVWPFAAQVPFRCILATFFRSGKEAQARNLLSRNRLCHRCCRIRSCCLWSTVRGTNPVRYGFLPAKEDMDERGSA